MKTDERTPCLKIDLVPYKCLPVKSRLKAIRLSHTVLDFICKRNALDYFMYILFKISRKMVSHEIDSFCKCTIVRDSVVFSFSRAPANTGNACVDLWITAGWEIWLENLTNR